MSYAFATHLAELVSTNSDAPGLVPSDTALVDTALVDPALAGIALAGIAPDTTPFDAPGSGWFALVDVAQLRGLRKPLPELVPDAAVAPLFEEPASCSATELSPLLFALAGTPARRRAQALALDGVCRPLPVLSLLRSPLRLHALRERLRSLQRVEAGPSTCLLRFADTQMLAALNTVLTPAQRTRFFQGIAAWWSVDHDGLLCNAADARHHPRDAEALAPIGLPLRLDTAQTRALLDATAVPALATQVRFLEASFADTLTHAQQTGFISNCLATAQHAGIRDDTGRVMWALQRWQAEQARRA